MRAFTFKGGPTIELEIDLDTQCAFKLEERDLYHRERSEELYAKGSGYNLRQALNKLATFLHHCNTTQESYKAIRDCISGLAQYQSTNLNIRVRTMCFVVANLLMDEIRATIAANSQPRFLVMLKTFDYICALDEEQIGHASSAHELMQSCISYAEEHFDDIGQSR